MFGQDCGILVISITFQSRKVSALLFLGLATSFEVWYLYDKYQVSGCRLTNETADTCKAKEKKNTHHISDTFYSWLFRTKQVFLALIGPKKIPVKFLQLLLPTTYSVLPTVLQNDWAVKNRNYKSASVVGHYNNYLLI